MSGRNGNRSKDSLVIRFTFAGGIVGVLAVFLRVHPNQSTLEWLSTFAAHAAVAIGNCRAFQQIDQLRRQLELERDYLREEVVETGDFRDIVGQSPALMRVLQQIDLVAQTDSSVLIQGESGTGKELIARAIHQRSRRADKALIRVNCGSIPKDLFESEFFGHVKGSFTGAIRDRVGRFQLADGGTLFLDEVGEIPLDLQSKLLRVLQEGEFERVGDEHTRRVNVRVIAATNRDLRTASEEGRFPAGPVLPAERVPAGPSPSAGPAGRHSAPGVAFREAGLHASALAGGEAVTA